MFCKHCGAKLEDDAKVCSGCGKNTEVKEEKEVISPWKLILATSLCVLLLAVLAVVVINSITGRNWPLDLIPEKTTAATEAVQNVTEVALGTAEDLGLALPEVVNISMYTDEAAAKEHAGDVIAQIGDYQLTNSLLQVFYWTEYGNFVVSAVENGYDLATNYGLDIYSPMYSQKVSGYDVTWEQYFLHQALQTWLKYVTVNMMADEAGYQLDQESLDSIASVPEQLAQDAVDDGYADVEALIDDRLGISCDLADYVAYMEFTARADMYYTFYLESYEPTDEEVEEFFDLNADYYGYYYALEKSDSLATTVRHILIQPEGCQLDENNLVVATDEQWEACRVAAQAMLDAWVADGASEDAFATLATENSKDTSSATKGGLFTALSQTQVVEAFGNWCYDPARVAGDYGLVKSEYGYHLMYFISISDKPGWYTQAKSDAISYGYGFNKEVNERMNNVAPTFALESICLGDVAEQMPETTETTQPTESTAATTETTVAG